MADPQWLASSCCGLGTCGFGGFYWFFGVWASEHSSLSFIHSLGASYHGPMVNGQWSMVNFACILHEYNNCTCEDLLVNALIDLIHWVLGLKITLRPDHEALVLWFEYD